MQQAEAELKAQIDALLARAATADAAEQNEPEVDLPAEIARRESRLAVIRAAKERLEQRQREADAARGRTPGDERRPRDPDGTPKRGPSYKREFGIPKADAQENFTDTDSRIMKRTGGGFDASYNAYAAVDDQAHIIIAAELTNNAADSDRLAPLLDAIESTAGALPEQALGDAGFRCEAMFEQLQHRPVELIVALGREGKEQLAIDALSMRTPRPWPPGCRPRTRKRLTDDASGFPNRPTAGSRTCWAFANSTSWLGQGQSRVATGLRHAEFAPDGHYDAHLSRNSSQTSSRSRPNAASTDRNQVPYRAKQEIGCAFLSARDVHPFNSSPGSLPRNTDSPVRRAFRKSRGMKVSRLFLSC